MEALPHPAVPARDADWRFFLPAAPQGVFEHLLLLGGSDALAAAAVTLGIARRVSTGLHRGDPVDAAVVLAGSSAPISAVAGQIADGGVLYWETDRRHGWLSAASPARASRRLARLGLTSTGAYWIKPGVPERDMYLPLEADAAFDWYLDTLYRATSRTRRAVKAVIARLPWRHRALRAFAPCFVVTATRGAARTAALIASARAAGIPVPVEARLVVIAHGHAEWSRVAVLLFEPGRLAPVGVIKLPRSPAFNGQTDAEHHTLRHLARRLSPALRHTVPRSVRFPFNGLTASVETCLRGSAISTRAGRAPDGATGDVALAVRWLTAFHRETTLEIAAAREWLTRHLLYGLVAEYGVTFVVTRAEQILFDTIAGAVRALGRETLPIVVQHTDFGPWNVYRDDDRVGVIDWEVARRGPALVDLLYFVTHWTAAVAQPRGDDAHVRHFEALFCGASDLPPSAAPAYAHIVEYMHRLNVAPSLLPFLLLYTVLEQALDRAHRLSAVTPARAPSRAGNRYVGYVEALARYPAALFVGTMSHAA